MTVYYLDASALVKRYAIEAGSSWISDALFDQTAHLLITSRLSQVETRSALARRRRESHISDVDHVDAVRAVDEDFALRLRIIELDRQVAAAAATLLDRYTLKAGDAVQLASALLANAVLVTTGQPPLVFVAADQRLISASMAEGMVTEYPHSD